MRFSTATVLGLAVSASAAVLPRSQYGSWDVNVSKSASANGFQSETVIAVYTSDSYPEGVTSTCSWVRNPAAEKPEDKETTTCDEGFSYELSYAHNTKIIKLSQLVQKPSPNTTVFGTAPLTMKSDEAGRKFTAEVVVEATEAVA